MNGAAFDTSMSSSGLDEPLAPLVGLPLRLSHWTINQPGPQRSSISLRIRRLPRRPLRRQPSRGEQVHGARRRIRCQADSFLACMLLLVLHTTHGSYCIGTWKIQLRQRCHCLYASLYGSTSCRYIRLCLLYRGADWDESYAFPVLRILECNKGTVETAPRADPDPF